MSTNTTSGQESTATRPRHAPTLTEHSQLLGIDGEGAMHHYHGPANAVVVYHADDGVERYQSLGAKTLAEWYLHVNDRRGWPVEEPGLKQLIYMEAAAKRRAAGHWW